MKSKYESEHLEVAHELAKAFYQIGGMTDAEMQEMDELCLSRKTAQKQVEQPARAGKPTRTVPLTASAK